MQRIVQVDRRREATTHDEVPGPYSHSSGLTYGQVFLTSSDCQFTEQVNISYISMSRWFACSIFTQWCIICCQFAALALPVCCPLCCHGLAPVLPLCCPCAALVFPSSWHAILPWCCPRAGPVSHLCCPCGASVLPLGCPLCCPQCCPCIVLCCPCVAPASPLYCPLCPCVALVLTFCRP